LSTTVGLWREFPIAWWADLLIALGGGVLLTWVAIAVVLLRLTPGGPAVREILRLLPDVVRLLSRLARDGTLPRGVRIRLWLLLGYLASPVDIIPDFVPVIGYADDVIIVVLTLRCVVRRIGDEPLARHWPGTEQGLTALRRIAGLTPA
jgi:uncharacterized membrane protein YkvA (DUF1232 family)